MTAAGDPPAAGGAAGGGGGGGGAANAPTSFGILTVGGAATMVNGLSPALSRDGRFVSWITRTGPATGGGEQKLLVAATDSVGTPSELRKGLERLDAPALSADGIARRVPDDDRRTTGKSTSSGATAKTRRA